MKGRKWSIEEKMAIVLAGLKGVQSVSEVCREHQINQTQYYQWRDKFLAGAQQGLNFKQGNGAVQQLRQELGRLQRLIGKQAIPIEILKKTEELLGER
jgi:transposase